MTCFRALILIAASCLGTPSALAGPEEDAKAWLTKLVAETSSGLKDYSFKAKYRVEYLDVPDAREREVLRARVKDHPDHPDRGRLLELERVAKYGVPVQRYTLWFHHGEMRLNTEAGPVPDSMYVDLVDLRGGGWQMVPRQLFVLGPAASRPPGHGIEALTSNALNEVSDCVALNTALFGTTDGATFRFASDGTWEFSRQKEFPAGVGTLMVGGTWDGAAGSGTVTHASFRTLNEPGRVVFSSLASDFRTVPVFGSAVAHVMTAEQGGAPYRRVLLESIEPLDEETFRAVTVTPAIDGTDAVRGEVTFTELTDLTGGEPQYVVRGPEGDLQRLSFGETPRGRDSAVLQILGWCVAAALVVLIVLLRVRARST